VSSLTIHPEQAHQGGTRCGERTGHGRDGRCGDGGESATECDKAVTETPAEEVVPAAWGDTVPETREFWLTEVYTHDCWTCAGRDSPSMGCTGRVTRTGLIGALGALCEGSDLLERICCPDCRLVVRGVRKPATVGFAVTSVDVDSAGMVEQPADGIDPT